MTRKQWACLSLAMILGALSLIVGAVVFIDPFEVYHKATRFIPPIISGTQSYSNAASPNPTITTASSSAPR